MTEHAGIVVSAAGAPTLAMPSGGAMAFLASAADTGGAFALREYTIPPGTPPVQPHRHACATEASYVRAGELTFLVGEREVVATPGTLVVVPRGAVHAFGNFSAESAIMAMIDAPPNIAPVVWRRYGGEAGSAHGTGETEPPNVEFLPAVRWTGRQEGRRSADDLGAVVQIGRKIVSSDHASSQEGLHIPVIYLTVFSA